MNRTAVIILALLGLGLIIWHAVWRQGPLVEQDLGQRARAQLVALDFGHIKVTADGQELQLEGRVATTAERDQAVASVAALVGVTTVRARLDVTQPVSALPSSEVGDEPGDGGDGGDESGAEPAAPPFNEPVAAPTQEQPLPLAPTGPELLDSSLSIVLAEALQVRGTVADESARAQLVGDLGRLFPNKTVEQDLGVGNSELPSLDVVRFGLTQLALLDRGTLQFAPGRLTLAGSTAAFATKVQINSAVAARQFPGVVVVAKVSAPAADVSACQGLFDEMLALDNIVFASSKAEIDPASWPLLKRLRDALGECEFAVEIGGHTDSTGDDGFNQWLSEQRALAVKDYLISKLGADALAIETQGYGETRPIATNGTRTGRRKNRRIEFVIRKGGE